MKHESDDVAPSSEYLPFGQFLHVDWPVVSWYVPAKHLIHEVWPVEDW